MARPSPDPPTATPTATRSYRDVRGAKVYVETFGTGAPLVFLHGGLVFFDNNFAQQRDYFASFRKVIGFDRRGHGHSPDDAQPFSYKEMSEDTAALIEQLGVGPVDIVGHSDGANIGLILAHDHPRLVRHLVISGANLYVEALKGKPPLSPQQISEIARNESAKLPPFIRHDYEAIAPDGPGHWWKHIDKSYQMWLATPVILEPSELKAIEIPTLVIAGDHDFTSLEATIEIFRSLPKGQLMIVPGTGHGSFRLRPQLVNLAIREFLEQPKDKEGEAR
jgi:pimeloyl-ACP methyl ester carboxylesterase